MPPPPLLCICFFKHSDCTVLAFMMSNPGYDGKAKMLDLHTECAACAVHVPYLHSVIGSLPQRRDRHKNVSLLLWGTLNILSSIAAAVWMQADLAVGALTCLSVNHCWRASVATEQT